MQISVVFDNLRSPYEGLFHLVHVFILCVWVFQLCVYVHHTHAWCVRIGLWIPRQLQMAASSHVGAGNQTSVSVRAESALISLALYLFIFEKESHVSQTGRTCYVARTSLELFRILLPQAPNPRIVDLPPPWPIHFTADICNCQKSLQTSRMF